MKKTVGVWDKQTPPHMIVCCFMGCVWCLKIPHPTQQHRRSRGRWGRRVPYFAAYFFFKFNKKPWRCSNYNSTMLTSEHKATTSSTKTLLRTPPPEYVEYCCNGQDCRRGRGADEDDAWFCFHSVQQRSMNRLVASLT